MRVAELPDQVGRPQQCCFLVALLILARKARGKPCPLDGTRDAPFIQQRNAFDPLHDKHLGTVDVVRQQRCVR